MEIMKRILWPRHRSRENRSGATAFIGIGVALWFLSTLSACAFMPFRRYAPGSAPPSAASPSSPTSVNAAFPAPAPGPDGWWVLAQRLPQSDFGPAFAYFLAPANIHVDSLLPQSRALVAVPPVCPQPRGIQDVRLAPAGGKLAIFCGPEEEHRFWVWDLSHGRVYPVTVAGNLPLDRGEEISLARENPLWSSDGQEILVKVTASYVAAVNVHTHQLDIHGPIRGIPLAWDPQGRYLAEGVYDEFVPASDGSKQYGISHFYLLDWSTGEEKRWRIPPAARKFLPPGEKCQISDYQQSVGWEPRTGNSFLFIVACSAQQEQNQNTQYVFLMDRSAEHVQKLWETTESGYLTALWAPGGEGVLLQILHLNARGVPQDGDAVFLDLRGRAMRTWHEFLVSKMEVIEWGAP